MKQWTRLKRTLLWNDVQEATLLEMIIDRLQKEL
jgi:hypothetical protein